MATKAQTRKQAQEVSFDPNDPGVLQLSERQTIAWLILNSEECKRVEFLLYGGAGGGGKSMLGCYWQIHRRVKYEGTRGYIGRWEFTSLEDTTMKTFTEVWERYFQGREKVTMTLSGGTRPVAKFSNGSEILFRHLKPGAGESGSNMNRFGSLELTDAFIDEAPEVPKRIINFLFSRIRFKLIDGGPKLLMTGNPQPGYIRDRFVGPNEHTKAKLKANEAFVPAKVDDNPNKEFVRVYKKTLSELDDYDRARMLDGNWFITQRPDYPFYTDFNYNTHVKELNFNPDLPIHITFDFNVVPYITAKIWQVVRPTGHVKFTCRLIDEFCLTPPLNLTEAVCKAIIDAYPMTLDVKKDVFFYGDASGRNRDTTSKRHNYDIIAECFKRPTSSTAFRVPRANPGLKSRRNLINKAFAGHPDSAFTIQINSTCLKSINDYQVVTVAPDGTKAKKRTTENGVSFEPHGHCSDADDYLLYQLFGK